MPVNRLGYADNRRRIDLNPDVVFATAKRCGADLGFRGLVVDLGADAVVGLQHLEVAGAALVAGLAAFATTFARTVAARLAHQVTWTDKQPLAGRMRRAGEQTNCCISLRYGIQWCVWRSRTSGTKASSCSSGVEKSLESSLRTPQNLLANCLRLMLRLLLGRWTFQGGACIHWAAISRGIGRFG
jgi:hypothetical protein